MIRVLIAATILLVTACGGAGQQSPTTVSEAPQYGWTKLLDSAPWKKTYNYQLFSFRDTLWAFHPDGAWLSHNGIDWVASGLADTVGNQAFLSYVQSGDTILGLGHFEGNIEQYRFSPVIYRTTDCRNWQVLSAHSNLPHRFFYHPFVFNGYYWIIGGEDRSRRYADCWRSMDGVHWTKLKDSLPFGPRSNSQVVQLKGKLYLLDNDVWSSVDGLAWQQETDAILKGEKVFGYSALVFDERIWLLGCNRNELFTSQVLVSRDGKNWQPQEAPWLPRGGIAATVHRDKVYITGGKYGGTPNHPQFRYDNDVWVMGKITTSAMP